MKKMMVPFLGLTLALAACGGADEPATDTSTTPPAPTADTAPEPRPAAEAPPTMEDKEDVDDAAEIRQADSHVHGAANLAMALDGNTLSVEWESPLYNLLGFEHEPDTDTQREAVADAQRALASPASLFTLTPAARCVAASVAPVSLFEDDHDHDDAHAHDHDDDLAHDDEEDHHHDEDEHEHADVLLSYSFTCAAPEALNWMETALFQTFEALEQVELVYLGPATLVSETLTRETERIALGG